MPRVRAASGLDQATAIALALCLGAFALALLASYGTVGLTPDSTHYAIVARSLIEGHGYTVDLVPFHLGLQDEIRRVPQMHGLLRPLVLAPLFAVSGSAAWLVAAPGFAFLAAAAFASFCWARRSFGPAAGFMAMGLVLCSSRLVENAWLGLDDVGYAFFFVVAAAQLHRGLCEPSERRFAWAGVVAGIGLLEKLIGIFVPGLLLLLLLQRGKRPSRLLWRCAAAFAVPFLLFFSLYLLRNQAAFGHPGFGFSAIDWLWKLHGFDGIFALHDGPLKTSQVLAEAGVDGVFRIVSEQVSHAWTSIFTVQQPLPWLFPLSLALNAVHLRRDREFALLCWLSFLGVGSFVCLFYHAETRYFAMLLPLFAVSLAGVFARATERLPHPARAALATTLVVLVCVAGTPGMQRIRGGALLRAAHGADGPCKTAFDRVRRNAKPEDVLLSMNPWRAQWSMGLPTVVSPSGPDGAVEKVVRHYGVRWITTDLALARPRGNRMLLAFLRSPPPGLSVRRAGGSDRCRVYRVRHSADSRSKRRSEAQGPPSASM